MARTTSDAVKWSAGTLLQYERLEESYQLWLRVETLLLDLDDDDDASPTGIEAHRLASETNDRYMVDAHLFLVAASQLVKTLEELDRRDLLPLLPAEHITHARNAMEHDDERGLYQRDYRGYRWTIGGTEGMHSIYGVRVAPVVEGLRAVAAALGTP